MGDRIVARGLGFRHSTRKQSAFRGVNIDIPAGQRVLLVGASGVGKSTLLAAVAGVLGPDEGEFEGQLTVGDQPPAPGRVGMVLQDPDSQVMYARVGDDVAFGCENMGVAREEIWRRVPEALSMVGLDLPLDHLTSELSGGQKQRLALAGVIAMQPDVIVLDEPTANVDPEGTRDLLAAVQRCVDATGATLLVVEHRVDIWAPQVDRVIVLGRSDDDAAESNGAGAVVADGSPEDVLVGSSEFLRRIGIWVPEAYDENRGDDAGMPVVHEQSAGDMKEQPVLQARGLVTGWAIDAPMGTVVQCSTARCSSDTSGLDLEVFAGSSTVITGVNGVGKTTLALTLAGLLEPLAGTIQVKEYKRPPQQWSSRALARRIGFVFQDPEHQFMAPTVREELLLAAASQTLPPNGLARFFGQFGGVKSYLKRLDGQHRVAAEAEAASLLERLRLEQLQHANPFTLSGGQKRRLSVATALMAKPSIVILDEPTFGQDRRTFFELVELLRDLTRAGSAVISITHDPLFIELMGDQRWNLEAAR